MARSTDAQKAERLNAAHRLLKRGTDLPEAARVLAREFTLSRRQAYRYLQEAQAIKRPVPVKSPNVAITVKVPEDIATKLREYAHSTGSTIGDVVSRAVTSLLARERRRG